MIEKISNYIVDNVLLTNESPDEDYREVMCFGVTRILEDIPKFASIFFMCYLLGIINQFFVVLAITLSYKAFIGGAHARTNIGCFLISTIYFILPIMLAKYINYDLKIFYLLFPITIIFSIYVIIKIAPADTEEIPIINKYKRRNLKICAGISLLIITILILFFIKEMIYLKIIIYTMLIINLFTLKPMYRLLRCKYGIESEEYGHFYK
jgi:accessory gene regulator B